MTTSTSHHGRATMNAVADSGGSRYEARTKGGTQEVNREESSSRAAGELETPFELKSGFLTT